MSLGQNIAPGDIDSLYRDTIELSDSLLTLTATLNADFGGLSRDYNHLVSILVRDFDEVHSQRPERLFKFIKEAWSATGWDKNGCDNDRLAHEDLYDACRDIVEASRGRDVLADDVWNEWTDALPSRLSSFKDLRQYQLDIAREWWLAKQTRTDRQWDQPNPSLEQVQDSLEVFRMAVGGYPENGEGEGHDATYEGLCVPTETPAIAQVRLLADLCDEADLKGIAECLEDSDCQLYWTGYEGDAKGQWTTIAAATRLYSRVETMIFAGCVRLSDAQTVGINAACGSERITRNSPIPPSFDLSDIAREIASRLNSTDRNILRAVSDLCSEEERPITRPKIVKRAATNDTTTRDTLSAMVRFGLMDQGGRRDGYSLTRLGWAILDQSVLK